MLPCRSWLLIITVLLLVSRLPEAENADASRFKYRQKRQAVNDMRQYCGRSLSTTLQDICDGVYNARFKKSNQDGEVNDYPIVYDFHPFKSPEDAKRMLRYRRKARGIYDECCLKSCSRSELLSYCGGR